MSLDLPAWGRLGWRVAAGLVLGGALGFAEACGPEVRRPDCYEPYELPPLDGDGWDYEVCGVPYLEVDPSPFTELTNLEVLMPKEDGECPRYCAEDLDERFWFVFQDVVEYRGLAEGYDESCLDDGYEILTRCYEEYSYPGEEDRCAYYVWIATNCKIDPYIE